MPLKWARNARIDGAGLRIVLKRSTLPVARQLPGGPQANRLATYLLRPQDSGVNDPLNNFFTGFPDSRPIFDAVQAAVAELMPATMRVSKSQIAFRRRIGFAWVWIPERYLRGRHAPLVLSVALRRGDESPRWKEIVEPAPGRFMHHLELTAPADVDDEVRSWLAEAWVVAA